ncbi:hypothetical protein BJF84_21645 [Rhodococcus sp. CUA-806]|nr:hypothetical protein BJF84_21645 [Rhodococcus sp. CUA-806]
MPFVELDIQPLVLDDPRQATARVHTRLRELIYSNELPPGTELSQLKLAKALGVSRTPLREALRRLQQEGLIEAELNKRCKVLGLDEGDLDATYGARLVLEALGMRMSLPLLGAEDLLTAERALAEMDTSPKPGIDPQWHQAHHRFHRTFTSKAPESLQERLVDLSERTDRYVRQVAETDGGANPSSMQDHYTIFAMVSAGRRDAAVVQTVRHLARTPLKLIDEAASKFEPVTIRAALAQVCCEPVHAGGVSSLRTDLTERPFLS